MQLIKNWKCYLYRAVYHYEISIIIPEIDIVLQCYENCSARL